jgi:phosphohistidine phosphatase
VEDLYGDGPDEVLRLLNALPEDLDAAMVVGHNPTMHALAVGLLDPGDEGARARTAQSGFPTCALGVYRFPVTAWTEARADSATLVALLRPPYDRS